MTLKGIYESINDAEKNLGKNAFNPDSLTEFITKSLTVDSNRAGILGYLEKHNFHLQR